MFVMMYSPRCNKPVFVANVTQFATKMVLVHRIMTILLKSLQVHVLVICKLRLNNVKGFGLCENLGFALRSSAKLTGPET